MRRQCHHFGGRIALGSIGGERHLDVCWGCLACAREPRWNAAVCWMEAAQKKMTCCVVIGRGDDGGGTFWVVLY